VGSTDKEIGGGQRHIAREAIQRLEFLVDIGTEPPVKLALARSSLHELEAQDLEHRSSFTSRRAALERSVQAAKLTVGGVEPSRVFTLEEQWVRESMSGLAFDPHVKSVMVKGACSSTSETRSDSGFHLH
jgi:hypothetical protein